MVNPNGSRLWYFKYRINGKESRPGLGASPVVSLADARQQREGIPLNNALLKPYPAPHHLAGVSPEALKQATVVRTETVYRDVGTPIGEKMEMAVSPCLPCLACICAFSHAGNK